VRLIHGLRQMNPPIIYVLTQPTVQKELRICSQQCVPLNHSALTHVLTVSVNVTFQDSKTKDNWSNIGVAVAGESSGTNVCLVTICYDIEFP
jgi:hypothetical protein